MRVLHITPAFHPADAYGGPPQSAYGLVRALARAGADVRVLTTDANGPRRLSVDCERELTLEPGLRVRYFRRAAFEATAPALFSALGPRVAWSSLVHLHAVFNSTTLPTLALARALDRPLVWTPRGALQRWAGTRRRRAKALWMAAARRLCPRRTLLHVTSEAEREQSAAALPGTPAVVIPNGVEVPEATVHHPSTGGTRFVFVGRLDPIKGLENLLAACARVRVDPTAPRFRLTIAGAGQATYEGSLRALTTELGLAPVVEFVGPVDEAGRTRLFERSDCLVLPSHSENFGLVVVEAMAHGLAVIASRGTPWAALPSVRAGFWTDNAPESLAAAMLEAARSDLREMGAHARAYATERFSWSHVAERMLATYERMIREAP